MDFLLWNLRGEAAQRADPVRVSGIGPGESLAIKCRSDGVLTPMPEIALYQPDIPPNVGTILRLGACLGIIIHIIEPTGFAWSERSLRRAGLDYAAAAAIFRHASYEAFCASTNGRRQVLLSTKAELAYTEFAFRSGDILVMGRETSGVPDVVHRRVEERITIPMRQGMRSLNVAIACAMVLGEALRQTGGFPETP
jgi:tRNA (cytidine/uridine-2'-O-)-methyltransferase